MSKRIKLIFQGDSITDAGRDKRNYHHMGNGYPKYAAELIEDNVTADRRRLFVTHAGCDEETVEQCVSQIKQAVPFEEVIVSRAGCTISSHCGRNTLGILFMRK